jgi:hypothetical protein
LLWAIGAILLHFPVQALPQAAVPAASRVVAEAGQTQEAAPSTGKLVVADSPASDKVTAFEPGKLVLTPAGTPEPAPAAASPAPISPAIAPARKPAFAAHITDGQRNLWLGLAMVQHGAATFDAWSTRRAISRNGAQELNPMLKPFAGNRSIYAATQIAPTLLDLLGRHMMTSHHPLLRHTWWLPQVLGTAASLAGGAHNLRVH